MFPGPRSATTSRLQFRCSACGSSAPAVENRMSRLLGWLLVCIALASCINSRCAVVPCPAPGFDVETCRCAKPFVHPSAGAGLTPGAGELAACGADPGELTCCPIAWKAGGRCSPNASPQRCWTECIAAGFRDSDGGTTAVRAQLACETDGTILSGLGLFPCEPTP